MKSIPEWMLGVQELMNGNETFFTFGIRKANVLNGTRIEIRSEMKHIAHEWRKRAQQAFIQI